MASGITQERNVPVVLAPPTYQPAQSHRKSFARAATEVGSVSLIGGVFLGFVGGPIVGIAAAARGLLALGTTAVAAGQLASLSDGPGQSRQLPALAR